MLSPKDGLRLVLDPSGSSAGLLCSLAPPFGLDAEHLKIVLEVPFSVPLLSPGAAVTTDHLPKLKHPSLTGAPLPCLPGLPHYSVFKSTSMEVSIHLHGNFHLLPRKFPFSSMEASTNYHGSKITSTEMEEILLPFRPMTMGTRCCKVFFPDYSKKNRLKILSHRR